VNNKSKGLMLILSSPSGAGKTTLSKKIQQKHKNFKISVSHTTRKPRSNEVEGVDYFFISKGEFEKRIKDDKFYEYAKIFDNYYGTSKKNIDDLRKKNYDILFDIDWQGTLQLSKYKELNLIKVFILPPNLKSLEERLKLRNQDDKASVKKRLNSYKSDRKYWYNYDHILINDNLDNCFRQLEKIIEDNKAQLSL
tara:strand:+ start:77 stop:661 length:585 start_codon:yes stop_codon:yes gene_type:complete